MLAKISCIPLIGLLSLGTPANQSQADEIAALKRQVQELRAQQEQMLKELTAIKNFLQALMGAQQGAEPQVPGLVGASIPIAGEASMGSPSAKVTVIEISDYHCPFCKRQTQQVFPQLKSEYIDTGKVRFVFIHYPIAQLHPAAQRSHEAAACAGEQGRFWEMHFSLFNGPVARDDAALVEQAKTVGLDTAAFSSCLTSGRHTAAIRASVARVEKLGIEGTPMTLIGQTPSPGEPMKVGSYVYGARPYADFKAAIEAALR